MIPLGVYFAKRVAGAPARAHLRRADPWDEMLSAGLYVESGLSKFHLLQCRRIGKVRSVNTDARGSRAEPLGK
jgi:hypothetical protein